MRFAVLCFVLLGGLFAADMPLVPLVRTAAATGDFNLASRELKSYRDARGATPEYIEALSWVGRGELAAKQYAPADQNAAEVRKLCLDQIAHRKLDSDASLTQALGASIEVHALVAAMQGRRDEAVVFLRAEAQRWRATSILPRIEKNLNLLTLEGKPAPPLELTSSLTAGKLMPLAQHAGHPVLLFFWAHWCADCKAEIAIIERLGQAYGPRGLVVVAPTQHYGYVAGGQDAPRDVETKYMKEIFAQYYAGLGPVEVPVSEANFSRYGVSTTPTLVLLDARGIVRLYNPGALTWEQLAPRVDRLFQP